MSEPLPSFLWYQVLSSKKVQKERLKLCKECEHYIKQTTTCKKCACFMSLKVKLEKAECPIKKW